MPKITKAIIESLQPRGADIWCWDSTLPGFGVRAQASGRRTYVARYRTSTGRQRKLTIGRCCDLSPDQARDLATTARYLHGVGSAAAAAEVMAAAVSARWRTD